MDLPIAKKSLGQHWLTDNSILSAICESGEITPDDVVLEIGPGTGTLTELLVQQAKQVIAVEFDESLAQTLPSRVQAEKLKVVQQDILQFDFTCMPADYKVIANIPYYLTSKLIRVLSETSNQAQKLVLLIQKEVAERVAAKPGDMSLLSVSAQYYWDVSLDIVVPARAFTPPPKVDSQVLVLNRRGTPLFQTVDEKVFFQVVKAGFAARRKTLGNSLSGGLRLPKSEAEKLLRDAHIDPSMRAQTLSIEQWHDLYRQVEASRVS